MILLAAGASRRLGKPKQLLRFKGKTLLGHAVSVIGQTAFHPVVIVVGANASLVKEELNPVNVEIINNIDWEEGIASSIRTGIKHLSQNHPDCNGVILMVADQPYITSSVLNELLQAQQHSGKPMAACQYENVLGTPALFHQSLFAELLNLPGDKGAGSILFNRKDDVAIVDFPAGSIDIDTEEDYDKLQGS